MQDGHASPDVAAGPSLSIRPAGLDDYSTIRHVQASAIRALADSLIDANEVTAAFETIYSPSYVTELMTRSVFIAVLNGDIVGTCAWSPGDDRGHAARISNLFVLPLFQGRGIARGLLEYMEADAKRHGYSRTNAIAPVAMTGLFKSLDYAITSFGTSRDVVPGVALQVVFFRKPEGAAPQK
jgi:GNAT superfamily N-acetyltransferase